MIDYVNYNQIRRANTKNKKDLETTLTARLEFKNEVAPKDVKNIKYRLRWRTIGHPLKNYFNEKGFASSTYSTFLDDSIMCFYGSSSRKVILKENPRKLRLEIKITSSEDILQENMFDLEGLNTFIRTGKQK